MLKCPSTGRIVSRGFYDTIKRYENDIFGAIIAQLSPLKTSGTPGVCGDDCAIKFADISGGFYCGARARVCVRFMRNDFARGPFTGDFFFLRPFLPHQAACGGGRLAIYFAHDVHRAGPGMWDRARDTILLIPSGVAVILFIFFARFRPASAPGVVVFQKHMPNINFRGPAAARA